MQERGLFGADLSANGRRAWNCPPQCDCCLLKANVPNVFVAGDVRHGLIKRVASLVGQA